MTDIYHATSCVMLCVLGSSCVVNMNDFIVICCELRSFLFNQYSAFVGSVT